MHTVICICMYNYDAEFSKITQIPSWHISSCYYRVRNDRMTFKKRVSFDKKLLPKWSSMYRRHNQVYCSRGIRVCGSE